jgi:hypothetical protein
MKPVSGKDMCRALERAGWHDSRGLLSPTPDVIITVG